MRISKRYKTLTKNIGLFAIGNFGSKVISFLLLPLYTAVLSTSDYGFVDLLQTTTQLLIPILLLSIQDATLRFGMDANYEKSDVISTSLNIVIKGSTVLLVGIIFVSATGIIQVPFEYWVFLFASFMLSAVNNCLNLHLRAKNRADVIAVGGIIGTLITCVANIICLTILNLGIVGYMTGILVGLLSQFVYQFCVGNVYRDYHVKKYNNLSRQMIKYSAPLVANSISWWVNNASDRYILTLISGVVINGIYAVAYKIPTILTTLQGVFYNAWSISAIAEFDEEDKTGFIGKNYMAYSFLSIIACSVVMLLNIPLADMLYSDEFFMAWQCVPFLLIGTTFNGVAQFEGSLFAATRKTKEVSKTTIISAIVNIIGNFIFIGLLGAVGAALSTMISYIVLWALRTKYMIGFVKAKIDWKRHIVALILLLVQSVFATLNTLYALQIIIVILLLILHAKYIGRVFRKLIRKDAKVI